MIVFLQAPSSMFYIKSYCKHLGLAPLMHMWLALGGSSEDLGLRLKTENTYYWVLGTHCEFCGLNSF